VQQLKEKMMAYLKRVDSIFPPEQEIKNDRTGNGKPDTEKKPGKKKAGKKNSLIR
jgi:hypothetical protein